MKNHKNGVKKNEKMKMEEDLKRGSFGRKLREKQSASARFGEKWLRFVCSYAIMNKKAGKKERQSYEISVY